MAHLSDLHFVVNACASMVMLIGLVFVYICVHFFKESRDLI